MRFLEPRRGSPEVSPAGAGMPGEVKADEDLTTCRLQVVWFVSAGGWILGAFSGRGGREGQRTGNFLGEEEETVNF